MDIALYYNSKVANWHINQCQISGNQYSDLDEFLNLQNTNKFAIMHTPAFADLSNFESDIDSLKNKCDLIILLSSELHQNTVDLIERTHNPKIINFVCGALNNIQYKTWMDWFVTSSHFYRNNKILEHKLIPWVPKPRFFDILLGQPKEHRSLIYNFAKDFEDSVIMTYFKNHYTPIKEYSEKNWIWESEGLEIPDHDFNFTVTPVKYYGQSMSLSQVVPIKIYNKTAYSIVCETNFENHYSFFTEKTVKAILGRRLFLLFGGKYQLRNLRQLGFKTFDGIIDEGYDLVDSTVERGNLIIDQMKYLMQQDQQKILDQVKPIAEYNYKLMIETDWYADFARELRAVLLDHTRQN